MFRPARMLHAKLFLSREKVPVLIEALHEEGICELKEAEVNLPMLSAESSDRLLSARQRLARLKNLLSPYRPITQPENLIKSLFFPSAHVKKSKGKISEKSLLQYAESLLAEVEPEVENLLSSLKSAEQKHEWIMLNINRLSLMPDADLSLFSSTQCTETIIGIVAKKDIEKIMHKLGKAFFLTKEKDEKTSLVIVFCLKGEKASIEKELHNYGFEPIILPFKEGKPSDAIRLLEEEQKALSLKVRALKESLEMLASSKLEIIDEADFRLSIFAERENAKNLIASANSFSIIEAWLPEKNLAKLKKLSEQHAGAYILETCEDEDAPTLLENPKPFRPFEIITGLYSLPKSKGLDPTPVIAITFPIFFGYMLSDFVYGLVIFLFALAMLRGMGRKNKSMKSFSSLLLFLGLSTMFFGASMTSYLGDFFPRIGIRLPGIIDPMRDVLFAISLAIIIGAAHIFIGLALGFMDNISKGRKRDALAKQGVWLMFLSGIVLFAFGGFFTPFAIILMLGAVILNLTITSIDNGPVMGALSVLNFSGFFGDICSYARLTALAIGSAGIGLAVNFMSLLVLQLLPFLGLPLAIAIFVVGHTFNMLMGSLGAFIHSLRLHFLEFFQKFYEGGGRPYKPFSSKRETLGGV